MPESPPGMDYMEPEDWLSPNTPATTPLIPDNPFDLLPEGTQLNNKQWELKLLIDAANRVSAANHEVATRLSTKPPTIGTL